MTHKTPGKSTGKASKKAPTKFQQLAKRRGVDLPAERSRAEGQASRGETIQGTTEATKRKSSGVTGSFEEPTRGQKTLEVFKRSLPFSSGRIVATTDNRVFNTALEYVANSPDIIASVLTGGAGALGTRILATGSKVLAPRVAAGTIGKFTIGGKEKLVNIGGRVIKNTKNAKLSTSLIAGILSRMKKPLYVLAGLTGIIGQYAWSEWALGEAKEGMIFNAGRALDTGDSEIIREFQRVSDEIFDITLWENVARLIPGPNFIFTFGQKAKGLMAQKAVNDALAINEIIKIDSGETDKEYWERVNTQKAEQKKAETDYFNQQRIITETIIQDIKSKGQQTRSDIFKRRKFINVNSNEDLKKALINIDNFWIQYRATALQIRGQSRAGNFSSLNFGLI